MISGILHVAVHVRDLDTVINFCRDAFSPQLVGELFAWKNHAFIDTILDEPNSAERASMLMAGTCYAEMLQNSAPAPESDRP